MPDTSHTGKAVLDTLFYPVEAGFHSFSGEDQKILFLNARSHRGLSKFPNITLQQYFKPYAAALEAAGFAVTPNAPVDAAAYDAVFLAAAQNQIETLGSIAAGLRALKPGGALIVAAANKAGAGRLIKNLERFGLQNIQSETRNKCRVVWAVKDSIDDTFVAEAYKNGQPQSVLDDAFQSWPGIFGWNKTDQGSAILLQHLPADLKSRGADFGCGYGLLARHVLQQKSIKHFTCVDADWRALEMCRQNLKTNLKANENVDFEWMDLTKNGLSALDFIVMNPPFHEGKITDSSIGVAFITNAAKSLKRGGKLWMVANRQLPYEPILQQHFHAVENVFEGQGFKIFAAVK